MAWNLPPGVSDKDIDDAAPQQEPESLIQCDNCLRMGTEDEVWSSWHPSYGDVTQCYECRGMTREELGLDD